MLEIERGQRVKRRAAFRDRDLKVADIGPDREELFAQRAEDFSEGLRWLGIFRRRSGVGPMLSRSSAAWRLLTVTDSTSPFTTREGL